MRLGVIVLAAVAVSSAAFAASEPRQPTGKWIVNFDDAQCIATRNYGSEEDPIYLVLKAPAIGDMLQIGIVRKGSTSEPSQAEGEIVFDNAPPIATNLLQFSGRKTNQKALTTNLPRDKLAPMLQAKSIRIRAKVTGTAKLGSHIEKGTSYADEQLSLSQIPALLKTLDQCATDLRNVWRVWDEKEHATDLKEGPSGNVTNLFDPDDYPAVALMKEQMGTVAFVLLIDEQGKVADCTVIQTSGVAVLDAQSCGIVKTRAKFKPAIRNDGLPAKSAFFQRITWRLE